MVVQWLRRHVLNTGGPGSISGQGTRSDVHAKTKSPHAAAEGSYVPQLKDPACCNEDPAHSNEDPCATTKTQRSQINK